MKNTIDVKNITPFLQSSINIFEMMGQPGLAPGKPRRGNLNFEDEALIIQLGVTGVLKGQVLFTMSEAVSKEIAGMMMFTGPVPVLDDIARSALSELGNMIMGNTATIFSNQDILIDITPPMTLMGSNIKMQSEVPPLEVPLMRGGEELMNLFICLTD